MKALVDDLDEARVEFFESGELGASVEHARLAKGVSARLDSLLIGSPVHKTDRKKKSPKGSSSGA